jgi:hypothetical protein
VTSAPPTPPPGGGTDDQRGVGDPAGDDDVGAVGQRPRDPESTQVGVGRQRLVRPGRQRFAARQMRQRVAGLLQGVEAAEDVVASDVGDPQVVAVACDQFAGRIGQPGGVESSGVDDEPNPVGDEVLERRVEVLQEGGRIALGAVLGARLPSISIVTSAR